MKKFISAFTFILLVIVSSGVTNCLAEEPEAERNRELLEIWKDHVKTLTKERDTAYKEVERLKASRPMTVSSAIPEGRQAAPMAQFGGIETQPLPSMEAARMQGMPRDTQMQMSAMQSQLELTKKELADASREKDRLIQEKEKALAQIERMQNEKETILEPAPAVSGDVISQNLQKALDIQKKRNIDLQARYTQLESEMESLSAKKESESSNVASQEIAKERQRDQAKIQEIGSQLEQLKEENERLNTQRGSSSAGLSSADEQVVREAKQLRYENNTLLAKTERLQAIEKELQSTRAYFMPLVEELQKKNRGLSDDNQNMKIQLTKWQSDMDEISHRAEQSAIEGQETKSQLVSLRTEIEESANQISTLKEQLQIAEADKDKYQGMEDEIAKLRAENRTLAQSKTDLESSTRAFEEQVRSSVTELDTLRKDNETLRNRDQKSSKQIESLRARLRASLTDMKNLKSNFEAYLDSLVTTFDERQKTTT